MYPPRSSGMTRDAVPIPPLNSWQTIPVPPPTLPSATAPPTAAARAARRCSARTWKPLMSLSRPSYVSPTTGSDQCVARWRRVLDRDRDEGVAHDPDAVRVGDRDRRRQQARLADPFEAGHLAVAVEPMAARVDRLVPAIRAARHDHGDAGPDRARARRRAARRPRRSSRARPARPATSVMALPGPGRSTPDGDAEVSRPHRPMLAARRGTALVARAGAAVSSAR